MPAERGEANGVILVGPLAVRADATDVAAFAAALGRGENGAEVPLTFPVRWLALPAVRRVVMQSMAGTPGVLVQESQSFDYAGRIERDRDYSLAVEVRVEQAGANRIALRGTVRDADGRELLTLDTVLRRVGPTDSGAGSP